MRVRADKHYNDFNGRGEAICAVPAVPVPVPVRVRVRVRVR